MSRRQAWAEMGDVIDDEVLESFAVSATRPKWRPV